MGVICLRTKSRVCLKSLEPSGGDSAYGVRADALGLPYVSVYAILAGIMKMPEGISVGLGRIRNYIGVRYGVESVIDAAELSPKVVLRQYTEHYSDGNGLSVRVLKAGLAFEANIELPECRRDEFAEALAKINRIGYTNGDIPGEVELNVDWNRTIVPERPAGVAASSRKDYVELVYQIETVAPVCVYTPHDFGSNARQFITGEAVRDAIFRYCDRETAKKLEEDFLIFSNAYPQSSGRRGLPVPTCMSVEKLDKTRLHYRLAPVPPDFDSVQTVRISGFMLDPGAHTVGHFKSDGTSVFPISVEDDNLCGSTRRDAIGIGNMFRGFIRGSDASMRKLAALIEEKGGSMRLGSYWREGFGEVMMSVSNLIEAGNPCERLAREFDVYCASPAIMFDARGVNACDAAALLGEIESKLGEEGKLEIVKSYTDSEVYESIGDDFREKDSVMRCMAAGSSIRVRTKDGKPIDISRLDNSFVGDYNTRGFGEIAIAPAYMDYHVNAVEIAADKYLLSRPRTIAELQASADIIKRIMRDILDSRIRFIAFNDREEADAAEPPMFILENLRDRYDASMSDEELAQRYFGYLKNEDEGFDK